jgi:chromosome segregation ATPase
MPDPTKVWTLFMSDPVTFIVTFFGVAVLAGGFVLWLLKERVENNKQQVDSLRQQLDTRDERLRLASEKERALTEAIQTAKTTTQQLQSDIQSAGEGVVATQSLLSSASATTAAFDNLLRLNKGLHDALSSADHSFMRAALEDLTLRFEKLASAILENKYKGAVGEANFMGYAIQALAEHRGQDDSVNRVSKARKQLLTIRDPLPFSERN